jgi:hypothetical protein
MNVGEIKDELTKMLGNVLAQAGHPFVSPVDMRYRWITRACNKVPRLAAAGGRDILSTFESLFATFKAQTADGISWVDRPSSALIVREVWSFDKSGADADVDASHVVSQLTPQEFDAGKSSSESSGFPNVWAPKANRVYLRPQPRVPYLTDVHLYCVKREAVVFNSDAQTPMIGDDWHEAILIAAAEIGANALGYFERAKGYHAQLIDLVTTGVDVPVQEDLYDDPTFDFAGITQEDIYQ